MCKYFIPLKIRLQSGRKDVKMFETADFGDIDTDNGIWIVIKTKMKSVVLAHDVR